MELTKSKAQIQEADEAIAGQKAQLEKLNHVVAEADAGMGCIRATVPAKGA